MQTFKMAYVILCHKNPQQINLLLEALTAEHVEFFLHVDRKSSIEPQILHRKDIHFVKDPVDVQWGHYGQIECILRSFELIREHGVYDYIHMISGQDLPLVANGEIVDFFKENRGKEFVKHLKLPIEAEMWGCLYRVSVFYPRFLISRAKAVSEIRNRYINLVMSVPVLKRSLKDLPMDLYKGSNWMSITGECMQYILEFTKANPGYVKLFKNSFCGDEIFFHTIILNSKFKANVVNEIKRYTDWDTGPEFPRTLRAEDYSRIRQQGTECFWGRKFDLDVDRVIVEDILQRQLA
ncbi:beta-1,6-N-acetylglucosaminyltransferase [Paenibacillus tengchongensis]|uniref:beta-1,6-N-acetylglucosaminyltransferase n=1 Tax=Paenibacillus tengchongensis TaxID=2608684 RepID=UPI00124EC740|nr:beta-1,6-N-acetylglucosaminyltransferase [Paenibacillus tengchongensis]